MHEGLFMFFLAKGGVVMIAILLASVFALMIIVERIVYFSQFRRQPTQFLLLVKEKMKGSVSHKRAIEAIKICEDHKSPVGMLIKSIIEHRRESKEFIEKQLIADSQKIIPKFERWLIPLNTISTIAPLLGLLGTVIGMIKSFMVIAKGDVASVSLAAGISEALYTTAFGLIVAIPCIIFYNFFSKKIDSIVNEMEIYSQEFLNFVKK